MVDKRECNEIAILFEDKIEIKNDTEICRLYPKKVIEGLYDEENDIFYDKQGVAYYHVFEMPPGLSYGKRITFAELFSKYPNSTLKEAKKKYLEKVREKQYYYNIENNKYMPLIEYNPKTKKTKNFKDEYVKNMEIIFEMDFKTPELEKDPLIKTITQESPKIIIPKEQINIKNIYEELTKSVIGQEEAHKKILSSIWHNYTGNIEKAQNIFVNGPTGVGKTETFRIISEMIKVPIVIEDCNGFTMAGYVGRDVKEILENLLRNSKTIEEAERGIVVLDEVDKLSSLNPLENVSTSGVQDALLKMIEASTFKVSGKTLDTSKITFVGLGAFSGVEKQTAPKVGFNIQNSKKEYKDITPEDIIKYGIKREFIGRFENLVSMKELTEQDLEKILLESKLSPILMKQKFFKDLGINLEYDENFIKEIAKIAKQLNLGARSLKTAIESCLYDAQLQLAFQEKNEYKTLVVNKETVTNPKKYCLRKY